MLILRSRLIVLLLGFGAGAVVVSMTLTYLTPQTERRTFFDVAYLGLELLAILTPLLGSTVLQIIEFEQQTIWLVLVRPPSRPAYVWGRFLGLTLASWCVVGVIAALLAAVSGVAGVLPDPFLVPVIAAAMMEAVVVAALVCLAAFFATSYLTSLVITIGMVILGYLSNVLPALADKVAWEVPHYLLLAVYWVLPHLSDYAVRDLASAPDGSYLAMGHLLVDMVQYTVLYVGAVLLLSMAVFIRREV